MASIPSNDLLAELKLRDYYPQKLSFSDAIKLRGESQDGCSKYGLEIVRKLLTLDSTAVFSATTEINKRRKKTGTSNKNQRKLHPTDVLVVVMNCCDDFLRQVLVEKMFVNKLSIPIILPDVKNGSYTLLLMALRSLVSEVQNRPLEGSDILSDTLVDVRNAVISFLRFGKLHRSKSKLINELLSLKRFDTFFNRECLESSAKRSVSNGSIEAAWFQSEKASEDEFNCGFFTALNLRGDAKEYPRQTQFLCQSSTLVVLMVDSFKAFKDLYESVLKWADLSKTRIILCYISSEPPDEDVGNELDLWNDSSGHNVIYELKKDWSDDERMSDVDFANDLRETISKFFQPKLMQSNQMPTYCSISRIGKNFQFQIDEDKSEYELEKASAEEFIDLILKLPPDCKQMILPLQGEPWKKIGKLEREQRGKELHESEGEYFIADKETEKRQQREVQCRRIIQPNEIILKFSSKFDLLQVPSLLYFLKCCKIKLHARSRAVISNIMDEYKKAKQENHQQHSSKMESEAKLNDMELKIANSAIGLEHFLREHGQMYEAVISEEFRMREKLRNAPITLDAIRNFPSVMAKLLLMGLPLELMDGDASNVPLTWLNAVFEHVTTMTKNAKVFVLSIIGVQSSGKSTLLNALFGLQFPVSAGRCTKGIYCQLVPVDKESLNAHYDYVLVVDTEGLGASEFVGNSTFRDNELATFAIGVGDVTIINMKGENWAEMKDILQVVAYGLLRVSKTKSELELMPRCMFVHQNVTAADAEEKNLLGQDKQLRLLDEAIEAAALKEGFTEITKFDQVIKYDPGKHSWFFPDFWNGRPPKARTSEYYIKKTNELRQYLMQVMKDNPSNLAISNLYLRMSDLWNAMLHNDFFLCYRNTHEMISGTVLNDKISDEVRSFKIQNNLEYGRIRTSVGSFKRVEDVSAEKERIFREVSDAVEKNFAVMKAILQHVIGSSDICSALKQKYEISLNAIKSEELRRLNDATAIDMSVQEKKFLYDNDRNVKELIARLDDLEKQSKGVVQEKPVETDETEMKVFQDKWLLLVNDSKKLVGERTKLGESTIKGTIERSSKKLIQEVEFQLNTDDWSGLFQMPLVVAMPQVTENDIAQKSQNEESNPMPSLATNFVYFESHANIAMNSFHCAHKKWEERFRSWRGLEFNASHLEQIFFEVGQLLGILSKEHWEVRPGEEEILTNLPPGYKPTFTPEYIINFVKFVCHYTFNRSLENSKRSISLTDPLADIEERHKRSISEFQMKTAKENINFVSQQIFDYAKGNFVRDLGELILRDNDNPKLRIKRAFLRTILKYFGQKTHYSNHVKEEKEIILKEFMLYFEHAESEASENFFLDVIIRLLKEGLTKTNGSETDFQKMIKYYVGKVVEKAKDALNHAERDCKGQTREYVLIFKEHMHLTNEFHFRISTLSGFTEAVLKKIDKLYVDYLSKANDSTFDALVCKENKAAILPLFNEIMGCRERCPFCSAPCFQSLQHHAGEHRANHYPTGVRGTVDIWGWFSNTLETVDAVGEASRRGRTLSVETCQTLVGTSVQIRSKATVGKYNRWYHRWFNLDYHSFKNYKDLAEYENWGIPYSQNHGASLYGKWFMAQFVEQLAEHYGTLPPKIPDAWQKITWEEAEQSLDESYFHI